MKNFDWDGFTKNEFVVNCSTLEKAKDFLKECDSKGMGWYFNDKSLLKKSNWEDFKENTCYRYDGFSINFGNLINYENKKNKIVKWKYDNEDETIINTLLGVINYCNEEIKKLES